MNEAGARHGETRGHPDRLALPGADVLRDLARPVETLKVLMAAYACEPGLGSEAGIGWNWVEQASRSHEVWVVTRANNRRPIESRLEERALPDVHWIYFDLPRWTRFWKRGRRGARAYYYLWQVGAYRLAKRLHTQVRFDVVHHVTFGAYWMPTHLGRLGVPFIWGPVGGGESGPRSLYRTSSLRGRMMEHVRDLVRGIAEHDPAVRAAARGARLALATTEETAARLRRLGAGRVEVLSHVALSTEELERLESIPLRNGPPFRMVSIGRLLAWKGNHLGVQAFARVRREIPDAEYWIVGEGPEGGRLERLAERLGIGDSVVFWGSRSRDEVFEILTHCDVLVHPSSHDSGGYVCVEAMAAGRPVICLDLGGPGLIVSPDTGVKVPALTAEQSVAKLAEAMARLARDPDLRRRLGTGARRRVRRTFRWDRNGDRLDQLYRTVAAGPLPAAQESRHRSASAHPANLAKPDPGQGAGRRSTGASRTLGNFLIDLSFLGRGCTGVRLYALDLATCLERTFACRVVSPRHLADRFIDPVECGDPVQVRNGIVGRGRMSRSTRALLHARDTFVYCPYMQGVRGQPNQVITIHDLIAHQYPTRNLVERAYNRVVLPRLARGVAGVFTVSETVRIEIAGYYGLPVDRVHVVPNALDMSRWTPGEGDGPEEEPYLLVVSANRVYKNTTELLHHHRLWAGRYRLKIVSTRARYGGVIRAAVGDLGLERRVDFLDGLSEEELIRLYRSCVAVVYPSLMEGFGRPALEGMAVGRPVILSKIPVHEEVFGEAAIFITPGDPGSWERAFGELHTDPASLKSRIENGLEIACRYTLEKSCRRLTEALLAVEPGLEAFLQAPGPPLADEEARTSPPRRGSPPRAGDAARS